MLQSTEEHNNMTTIIWSDIKYLLEVREREGREGSILTVQIGPDRVPSPVPGDLGNKYCLGTAEMTTNNTQAMSEADSPRGFQCCTSWIIKEGSHLITAGQRSPDLSPHWSDPDAPGQQIRTNISIKGENETQFVILLACLSFVENRKIWNNKNTFTTGKVPTWHTHITLCFSECWAVFVKKSFHSALWYK